MTQREDQPAQSKKPYERPVLRRIELAADEVLAVGCKMGGVPAVAMPVCMAAPCFARGS